MINVLNHLNFPDSTLKSFIYYKKGFIPSDLCSDIINVIKEQDWYQHKYHNRAAGKTYSHDTQELFVSNSKKEIDLEVTYYLELVIAEYNREKNIFKN